MWIFILAFFSSFVLTYFIKKIAEKKNIIDIPNERSSHNVPTPRGGGLAIVITWYVLISYLFVKREISNELYFALLSGLILVVIGMIDDIKSLNYYLKFVFQCISAAIGLFFLGGLTNIDLGFFIIDNIYFLTIVSFIGILWFVNLFNFLDGIDGYISTEVIFISLASFIFLRESILLFLVVIILGFLIWNWQKAKIFMGDVGSTFLGYNIAVFAIYYQNENEMSIIIWLILSSVFWFDATLTLYRRWRKKEKIGQAHKSHFYQRIVAYGFSHQKTVFLTMFLNMLIFVLGFLAFYFKTTSLMMLIINIIVLFGIARYIDKVIDNRKVGI